MQKKKILSLLLSTALVTTMIPANVSAATEKGAQTNGITASIPGGGILTASTDEAGLVDSGASGSVESGDTQANMAQFQVGNTSETTYTTLAMAIANLSGATQITLTSGVFEATGDNVSPIPEGVTVVVKSGATVKLSKAAMVAMVPRENSANQGTLKVESGGTLTLAEAVDGTPYPYIGNSDNSYFKLLEGSSMSLGSLQNPKKNDENASEYVKGELTLTGSAEIPENQYVTLQLGENTLGMDLNIATGATLTVKGGLRGTSGPSKTISELSKAYPSKLTIAGTLDCTEGVLSLSQKAPVSIANGGKLQLGDKGLIGGSIKGGDIKYDEPYVPLNGKPVIELAKGGNVEVSAGNTRNQNLVSQIKSPAGEDNNAPIGHKGEDGKLSISGNAVSDLAETIAKAGAGTIINFPGNSATLNSAPRDFKAGVILNVNGGQTLTINQGAADLLSKTGTIKINAGGTVKLPNKSNQLEEFVGTTANARMNLSKGNIALDLGKKTLTIAEGSKVAIPNNQTSYTKLGEGEAAVPLRTIVEKDAAVTVANGGTWKVTKKATLEIKGTVNASAGGLLTLSQNANIDVTGKLKLPLMSKEQLQGTEEGTGLKGDITIRSGAELQYGIYTVLSQTGTPMIQLGEASEAVLNMGMADPDKEVIKLDLTNGSSSINDKTKTLLKTSDSTTNTVPVAITTAAGTTTTINGTLSLTNGSSLQADGAFNIEKNGVLEVHSQAAFTGKASVAGKAYIFDENDNPAKGAAFTLKSEGKVYGNSELTGTTIEPAQVTEGNFEYESISSGSQNFNRQWSYYSAPSVNPGTPSVDVTSITLNKTELTLDAGATEKLTAVVLPENATDKTVTWKSDNETVATVAADGTVTAAAEGIANITATAGGKTVTCKVTVTPKGSEVTSISLNKTELTLTAGETEKLTATVLPETAADKTVTWKSDNEAVATVTADGTVTATAEGTANITATAGGKTAVCKVTVSPVIEATGITLNKKALVLLPKKTAALKAIVLPAEAADKTVTWSSSRPSVAAVNAEGEVRAVKGGTAVITVKTANGKKAVCKVTVAKISLNASKLQMKHGTKTRALKVKSRTYTADKIKSVKSSRKNIVKATYKDGKITLQAKKNGKATVTVTMKSGAKAVCKITVNNKKVTTKKLTLNKKKAVVKAGKTVKLSVNRFPINGSEKIRWSTSNKKVAEVYKGRVKAKKKGKAVIKARTSNGKIAKCVITVTK